VDRWLLAIPVGLALVAASLVACGAESPTPTPTPRPVSQGVHTSEDMRAQYDRWPDAYKFAVSDDVVVLLAYPMGNGTWAGFAFIHDIPSVSSVTLGRPAVLIPSPDSTPVPLFDDWDTLTVEGKDFRAFRRYNSEESRTRLEAVLADEGAMRRILRASGQWQEEPATPIPSNPMP